MQAIQNTVEGISGRIQASKARKHDKETIVELSEIINDLLVDKTEIIRIAQGFREKLVAQQLSDDDIDYITATVMPLIKNLAKASANSAQIDQYMELLSPLLSTQTVKVLQLLGVNFRRAVGQPLTELMSGLIQSKTRQTSNLEELALRRDVPIYEVAQDEDATKRLRALIGR